MHVQAPLKTRYHFWLGLCRLDALRQAGGDMEVAIDPEELEGLDDTAVRALYEQRLSEQRARTSREVHLLLLRPFTLVTLLLVLRLFNLQPAQTLLQKILPGDLLLIEISCLQTVSLGVLICKAGDCAGLFGDGGTEGRAAEAQGRSAEGVRQDQEAEGQLQVLVFGEVLHPCGVGAAPQPGSTVTVLLPFAELRIGLWTLADQVHHLWSNISARHSRTYHTIMAPVRIRNGFAEASQRLLIIIN